MQIDLGLEVDVLKAESKKFKKMGKHEDFSKFDKGLKIEPA